MGLTIVSQEYATVELRRWQGEEYTAKYKKLYVIETDRMSTEPEVSTEEIFRCLKGDYVQENVVYLRYTDNYRRLIEKFTNSEHLEGKIVVRKIERQ
jgi:hypothetical protein